MLASNIDGNGPEFDEIFRWVRMFLDFFLKRLDAISSRKKSNTQGKQIAPEHNIKEFSKNNRTKGPVILPKIGNSAIHSEGDLIVKLELTMDDSIAEFGYYVEVTENEKFINYYAQTNNRYLLLFERTIDLHKPQHLFFKVSVQMDHYQYIYRFEILITEEHVLAIQHVVSEVLEVTSSAND